MRKYHEDGTLPEDHEIWVFGSNLAGRHGAGAALVARRRFGFPSGISRGHCGRAYAIPTKNAALHPRTLGEIKESVKGFIWYAAQNEGLQFFVTAIGCGLAGYSAEQIAPMFAIAPLPNCSFPDTWRPYLEKEA